MAERLIVQKDIVIRKGRHSYLWVIDEGDAELPISIKLANNGWRFIPNNNYDQGEFSLVIRIRRVEYEITSYPLTGHVYISTLVDDINHPIDTLSIPPGHPAIKFFQKTRDDKTIAIDMDFDAPKYGTGE